MFIQPVFKTAFLHPKYWPTWLALGFWRIFILLPFPVLCFLGKGLGRLFYLIGRSRRRIVETNLALCFPELSLNERRKLAIRNFENYGISVFELPLGWWASGRRIKKLGGDVKGLEHIVNLNGQGALLLSMHFVHVDPCAQSLVTQGISMDLMYRVHNNPVYEYVQSVGRMRRSPDSEIFSRKDVRGVAKSLKKGRLVWYAPDQDFGKIGTVFVPFFGVPAATITATSKFAALGNARVLPFFHYRRADCKGYNLEIFPPLDNFPSGDDKADAERINQLVESFVRRCPEQYLWAHRRFKTRPDGEPSLYQRHKR